MSKSLRSATDPGAVLSDRFPRDLTDVALTHSDARIVLDIAGHGRWTITVDDGIAEVTRDVATDPTCTVHTDADTLADLLIGRRSGVDAFLGGDLTTRGSLATVLQIGGAFAPDVDLVTRPRAGFAPRISRPDAPTRPRWCCCTASGPPMRRCCRFSPIWPRISGLWHPIFRGSVPPMRRPGPTPPSNSSAGCATSSTPRTPMVPW